MRKSPLRIAVAGLGVVGGAVVRALLDPQKRRRLESACGSAVELVSVVAKNRSKKRPGLDISTLPWDDSLDAMLAKDVDVVIELIGGAEKNICALVEKTIAQKRTLITANKQLLATEGPRLLAPILAGKGGRVFFEAAVGGSIPLIRTVGDYLRGGRIQAMDGILNGTCNWILTAMERKGCSMKEALLQAQKKGYAESEPSADIRGYDALYKSIILSGLAFGVFPDQEHVMRTGIEQVIPFDLQVVMQFGYRLRATTRIARVSNEEESKNPFVACALGPELLDKQHVLATVDGVMNALHVVADEAGGLFLAGPGAGGKPTAAAVLADLVTAARESQNFCHARLFRALHRQKKTPNPAEGEASYIRFLAEDQPGVMQDVTAVLAHHRISIDRIWQDPKNSIGRTQDPFLSLRPVALITQQATHKQIMDAYHVLKKQNNLTSVVVFPTRSAHNPQHQ